ncbi:Acetyl-CoA synthetase [Bordetella pertussis]|nr:Acetyl-CoA synthetase [Bordetella pertussis]
MLLLADAAGRPLEGGQRSLNAYDAQGYPVGNGFNRYALGDRDPVRYNPDGSLELYLQRDPPGPDDQANWLPTGEGAPGVILRIYLPQASVLAGRWVPPAARRVEAADD